MWARPRKPNCPHDQVIDWLDTPDATSLNPVNPQQGDMYAAWLNSKTDRTVLRCLFNIGLAENNWDNTSCNSSNHCGVFQLSSTLQAIHPYEDTQWWATYAIDKGFYGYGGLRDIAANHPTWSIGTMVNACQGAYSDIATGGAYYDGRLAESDAQLAAFEKATHAPTNSGSGSGTGGGSTSAPPTGALAPAYFNPYADAQVTGLRIDQGVDYSGTGPIRAIADGVVTAWSNTAWLPYGAYLEYRITTPGPLHGVYIYIAEGINTPVAQGDTIKGGQHIADFIPNWPYNTESGFAAGDGHDHTWSYVNDGTYGETYSTRAGIAFSNLMVQLKGPAGVQYPDVRGTWPPWAPNGFIDLTSGTIGVPPSAPAGTAPTSQPSTAAAAFDAGGQLLADFQDIAHGANIGRGSVDEITRRVLAVSYVTNKPPGGF